MEAYPLRMRKRIIELYQQGEETEKIAAALGLCRSGTRRIWQHFRAEGRVEPRPHAGGRPAALDAQGKQALLEILRQRPDAFLPELGDELQSRCGVDVHPQTIGRWLRELGMTRKKSRCTPPSRSGPT
jgi:transposase